MSLVDDIKSGKIAKSYLATPALFKDLTETVAWHDIVVILLEWIELRHSILETMGKGFHADGSSATLEDLAYTQGEIAMARNLIALPDTLIEETKEETDERKTE